MAKVYAIGETIYDIIFTGGEIHSGKVGGSVVNSAITLSRLGVDISLLSDIGLDALGDTMISYLVGEGIDCSVIDRAATERSPIAIAHLGERGDATYSFYKDKKQVRAEHIPPFTSDDIVLFGSSYALEDCKRSKLMALLHSAKEAGALIYYDPNVRDRAKVESLRERYLENISMADIIRGSDDDFDALFGIKSADELSSIVPDKALLYTVRQGDNRFVGYGIKASATTKSVEVLSTIGAGDNFNAGFIASLVIMGITKANIKLQSSATMATALRGGIATASEVCASYENYIPREFKEEFISKIVGR